MPVDLLPARSSGFRVSFVIGAVIQPDFHGQHEEALDWLERGLDERSRWMEIIGVLPVLDPLRSHPRFRKILQAMQLPDPS
jgi:hypothetical protein